MTIAIFTSSVSLKEIDMDSNSAKAYSQDKSWSIKPPTSFLHFGFNSDDNIAICFGTWSGNSYSFQSRFHAVNPKCGFTVFNKLYALPWRICAMILQSVEDICFSRSGRRSSSGTTVRASFKADSMPMRPITASNLNFQSGHVESVPSNSGSFANPLRSTNLEKSGLSETVDLEDLTTSCITAPVDSAITV